jgi:hypothetical protein
VTSSGHASSLSPVVPQFGHQTSYSLNINVLAKELAQNFDIYKKFSPNPHETKCILNITRTVKQIHCRAN